MSKYLELKAALSVSEFCELAGIGRTKLYQEIAANRILAKKCGRRTIIHVSELEKWLAALPDLAN